MSVKDSVPRKMIELQMPEQLCREAAGLRAALCPELTQEQFLCKLLEMGLCCAEKAREETQK